jgi:UDP-2,4-diacetamido-2,4,6-trideoxy-beta-L-altropyranose hydrolase
VSGTGAPEEFRLSPAGPGDARRLFALRNDPFVVAHSNSRKSVDWAEHEAWFAASIAAPDRHRILFIRRDDADIGVVRFERVENGNATISAYLLEAMTGRGIGAKAIAVATAGIVADWRPAAVVAHIVEGNERSRRAFSRAGYRAAADQPWRMDYRPGDAARSTRR